MSAYTDEALSVAFSYQIHFFMADRAAGVGMAGNGFFVSAFPILTDKHFSVFSIDFQHKFPTFRAFGACHIVMTERTVCRFDFLNESLCVIVDLFHKGFVGFFSFCDRLQAHFPGGSQFRTL